MDELYNLTAANHDFLRLIVWVVVITGVLQLPCLVVLVMMWHSDRANDAALIGALKAVKGYLDAADREHNVTANELKPAVVETNEITKTALEVTPQGGVPMPLGEYVQQNTHDLRKEMQRIVSRLDVLQMRIEGGGMKT